jgi:NAD(P)H dehydrogenase (quinone)
MLRISFVYFSQSGTTTQLVEAAAKGVLEAGDVQADLLRIEGRDIQEGRWSNAAILEKVTASAAVVFAAPTFMGGPAAQFKAFADATAPIWFQQNWKNKLAAGMTVSNSPSGDKLCTLMYLSILAAQHGMLWINSGELPRQPDGTNRLGANLGVMAQNASTSRQQGRLDPADAGTATRFGRRVAEIVQTRSPDSIP